MVQQSKMRKLLWCAAILYAIVMLWLLFGRSQFDIERNYWEQVKMNINFIPFNTIWQYLYLLIKQTNPYLLPHAFINLFGNIARFCAAWVSLTLHMEKSTILWTLSALYCSHYCNS